MKKVAVVALLLAGIIGWAVRDEANLRPAPKAEQSAAPVRLSREQFAQRLRDNAPLRERLRREYPETWQNLALQARGKLAECIVTEAMPGVLKAECQ
jgi:hypothetical protein